jgi:hypothetical protein
MCDSCKHNHKKFTQEQVIEKFKEAHGDKYIYDLVKYVNSKTKVEIICRIHGTFWQLPNDHWDGAGCRHCSTRKKITIEQFIERANIVHNLSNPYFCILMDRVVKNVLLMQR